MNVLIVVSNGGLGTVWGRHLERTGAVVDVVLSQEDAVEVLHKRMIDIIVLELDLQDGASLAISDFASYRQPQAKVIFVTSKRFFTDGSIFSHSANACAFVTSATPPDDIAALVEHHGVA